MYYILFYELVKNYLEERTAYRPQHFDHVKAAQARGEFIMGGAFDPAVEAALLFKVSDKTIIEDFAKQDPYVLNGLVTNWRIQQWNVVIGGN